MSSVSSIPESLLLRTLRSIHGEALAGLDALIGWEAGKITQNGVEIAKDRLRSIAEMTDMEQS